MLDCAVQPRCFRCQIIVVYPSTAEGFEPPTHWTVLSQVAGANWTNTENDLLVAEYFSMLGAQTEGKIFKKSVQVRELLRSLDRSKGAIEYKLSNVSAILSYIGMGWVSGYMPRKNIQKSLVDAVERQLPQHLSRMDTRAARSLGPQQPGDRELTFGAPPTLSNRVETTGFERTRALARKFDFAGRDARNRKLGEAGEALVLRHEVDALQKAGRTDLSGKVKWVSKDMGDGAGYDILSFDPHGEMRLLEVKTTMGGERTPFFITDNELNVSKERPQA